MILPINECAMSAAEDMAALLQVNKRALVFGVTSAGAGARFCQLFKNMPMLGPYAVAKLCFPTGFTLRSNGKVIENCGITPDVHCCMSLDDYMNGGAE